MLNYLEQGWGHQFVKAFGMSFSIAIISFVLSIIIGIGATLLASSRIKFAAAIVNCASRHDFLEDDFINT